MGAITATLAVRQMEEEKLVMQEGFGALAKVPPRYVAANDNRPVTMTPAGYTTDTAGRQHRTNYVWAGDGASAAPFYIPPDSAWQPLPDASSISTPYAPPMRQGDWLQTYTGRQFWSMDPRPDEIHIEDIAHSLSMQCRYAGHCLRFYSVAEHSVLMAWWLYRHCEPMTALCGLLHDASEAYLVDVPRPVKPYLTGYKAAEATVMAAVNERFGLPEMPRAVKEADDWIIGDELANMKPMDWHARYKNPLGVTLAYWSPAEAEERFLSAFEALSAAAMGDEV